MPLCRWMGTSSERHEAHWQLEHRERRTGGGRPWGADGWDGTRGAGSDRREMQDGWMKKKGELAQPRRAGRR